MKNAVLSSRKGRVLSVSFLTGSNMNRGSFCLTKDMRWLCLFALIFSCCGAADLKLGLLVPLHTLSGSELLPRKLAALAGLLAVKHVNQRDFGLLGTVDTFAVTANVSLVLGDTFSDGGIAVQRVLEWSQVENVHAVVGPSLSSVAVPVSYVAGALSLPVLSYGATSVSLSAGHPFFSRVIPTDAAYVRALAKLVQSFGWFKVGILYLDDEFGVSMFREFAAAAGKLAIKVDAAVSFEPGDLQSLTEAMRSLQNAMVRTIVVVTHQSSLEDIARTADNAGLIGGGVTWLLGNPNAQPTAVADASGSQELSRLFSGWIGLLRSNSTEGFSVLLSRLMPTDVDFDRIPLTQAELSLMPRYACPTCAFAYDAVWTLAFAAARLSNADFADGAALNQAIRQVRFEGVSGKVDLDEGTGDPAEEERVFHVVNWAIEAETLERRHIAELDVSEGLMAKDPLGPHWSDSSRGWTAPGDWLCETGSIFNRSIRECAVCPAGSFANRDTEACEVCGVGSVAGAGFGSCTPCRQGYADRPGMELCSDCPENTIRPAGTRGISVTECSCKTGYYLTHGRRRGEACAPCPSGAECLGGNATPYPQYGYWADTSCEQHGGDTECEAWDSFLQCVPATDCLGGPGAPCDGALTGRMCKETRAGWFNIGSSWRISCDKGGTAWSVAAMLATALAWFGINAVASGEYDAMDIALLYVQVTGIVSSFGLRWHPSLGMLNTCLSIANFDTDFVTPRCLFDWGPLSSFYLQLTLPFIWALAYVLWRCFLAVYLWVVRVERKSLRHIVREIKNPAITSTISLLIIVYHSICLKCFQAFSCIRFPNGHLYLSSAPQVQCWAGAHWGMVALAAVYIPAFVVGLPVAVVAVVRAKEREAQLNSVAFHAVWGRLYSRYDPGWKWWEAVLLLRRLLLSLIAVFVDPPMLQSALAVAVLAGLLTLHAYARPYTSDAIDMLEVFTLWGSMLYALFGLLFYPSISPSSQGYVCPDDEHACGEDNRIKAGIAMLLLAWTIATMVLAAYVSLYSIRDTSMSKKASRILHGTRKARSPSSSGRDPLLTLRTAFGRVSPLLTLAQSSEAAPKPRPRALSWNSTSSESMAGLDRKVPVEIDSVLKGGPLLKWVSSDQPQASLEASAKAFEAVQTQLGRLSQDDVGPNAVSFRANAFRQLDSFPGLVDFLTSFASDAQCEHLRTLLDSYSNFLATSNGDFPFTSLVVPEFRTSLVHSLIVSGSSHRSNFTLVCRQIHNSNQGKISEAEEAAVEGGAHTQMIGGAGEDSKPNVNRRARSRLITYDADTARSTRSAGSSESLDNGADAGLFNAEWSRSSRQQRHDGTMERERRREAEQHEGEVAEEGGREAEQDTANTNPSPVVTPAAAANLASGQRAFVGSMLLPGGIEEEGNSSTSEGRVPVCLAGAESEVEGFTLREEGESGRALTERLSA